MKAAIQSIVPLGDRAALVYCTDETAAIAVSAAIRKESFPWAVDLVPAYSSVGVHFDPEKVRFRQVAEAIAKLRVTQSRLRSTGRQHEIPCCYQMQLDLERVAQQTGLSPEEVIAKHTGRDYTVYAIGFAPGFPYLGYLPDELCGVPRLASPRLRVEPGSVGLTGRQTGIYPEARPGGWNIIGRTPFVLVDVEAGYFPLRVGDRVRFRRIDQAEFEHRKGERLAV